MILFVPRNEIILHSLKSLITELSSQKGLFHWKLKTLKKHSENEILFFKILGSFFKTFWFFQIKLTLKAIRNKAGLFKNIEDLFAAWHENSIFAKPFSVFLGKTRGENWIFIWRFWDCGRILIFKNGYKLDLFP